MRYTGRGFVAYNGVELEEIPKERNNQYYADKPYRHRIKLAWLECLREDKNLRSLIQAVAMLP